MMQNKNLIFCILIAVLFFKIFFIKEDYIEQLSTKTTSGNTVQAQFVIDKARKKGIAAVTPTDLTVEGQLTVNNDLRVNGNKIYLKYAILSSNKDGTLNVMHRKTTSGNSV